MMIIQLLLTSIILGIIYKKMLKWECDMSINKKQAFVPIFLGVLATMLTLVFALGIAFTFMNMGFTVENIQNVVIKSFVTSFWRAGLIEEISRLLMIILAIWLFKPKNVYLNLFCCWHILSLTDGLGQSAHWAEHTPASRLIDKHCHYGNNFRGKHQTI